MSSETILSEIEAGATALGISATTLCMRAVSNAHIPARVRSGGTVTVATLDRIRRYVAEQKAVSGRVGGDCGAR